MLKLKPEEVLYYIRSRLNKENKVKTELNIRNNNLLKNFSLYNTLNKFNINIPLNNNLNNSLNNICTQAKDDKNKETDSSKVLTLKKIKLEKNIFPMLNQNHNKIDIDSLKRHLNIKKKKYNKGLDFCSYFLQQKNNYYINALNESITNNFISFYAKAKEYYSDIQININDEVDCNSLKINNIKYQMLIVKGLNNEIKYHSDIEKKDEINIYEKCVNILKLEEGRENIFNDVIDNDAKTFLKGLNHNIQYYLEDYLENKIKLIDLNIEENALFEKGKYLNKYRFQFIKKLNTNNDISIEKSLIIPDKRYKFSFNGPRLMFPLFMKGLFDKINVFNQFSFFKNSNGISNNSSLNLFFEKNIDRPKEININNIYSSFDNSEYSSNILNGYYLINPFQHSINNKEFKQLINKSFLPKKLNKDLKSILGSKFNYNKYRKKRNYLNLINSQNTQSNKKESDNKLIIINKKTAKNYINNPEEYFIINDDEMDFDVLFDINICGKIFFSSEFYDQFQYNGYNSVCDLINKNYLYYNMFYLFLIDDEKMNKKEASLKSDKIANSIYQIIDNKFGFLKNDKYEFKANIKIVNNPRLMNYEINHLYEELINNNYNNEFSIYNNKIIDRILNEIKVDTGVNKDENEIKSENNYKMKFNTYEDYLLKLIKNSELKQEIKNMLNKKYSKLNIL